MTQYSDAMFGGKVGSLEVPAAFREMAEKGVTQARETYEKFKEAAENANGAMESFYSTASKGANDVSWKFVEIARINTNAAFDFVGELFAAKSYSDLLEVSTAYMHKQFETLTAQSKDLAACAQKVATETAEPIKEGITSAMKKAA